MSTNAQRLARAVRARRDQLDLSQLDVWQAGGPSNTTLTEIENARIERLTRTTARKLDAALEWEVGSARRVWDGGDPLPASRLFTTSDEVDDLRRRIVSSDFLTPDQRDAMLAALGGSPPPSNEGRRGA